MIETKEAVITNITVHRIGIQTDSSFINDKEVMFNFEEDEDVITKTFLKPFTSCHATYEFRHDEDVELNPIFKIAKEINEEADFVLKTKEIHQYLASVSFRSCSLSCPQAALMSRPLDSLMVHSRPLCVRYS